VIAGRFVIDRHAGAGGMSTVYRAFDRVTGVPAALKVLHLGGDEDAERAAREAAILAELDHPAIVRYLAHGVADSGEPWLAMEWLDGEDLAARLSRERLSPAECIQVAERAAAALACAHARGTIHRDVKPGNLFLPGGDPGRLVVLDFGVARSADTRRLTRTGTLLGTLGYVAPEQIRSEEIDARADVFALGCVLFECLTGRPAFAAEHPMAVLAKILLEGPPGPATLRTGVPALLDALVQRMLDKDRERRPRDGAAVAAALADLAAPPPEPPSSPSPPASVSLGLAEQRIVSVVLAGDLEAGQGTVRVVARDAPDPDLVRAVAPFGGKVALHAGRAVVITLWSQGDAADRAERAARCALALRERTPSAPICVVTGRGQIAERAVGGELIDRGVAALRAVPPGVVALDEATADALGPRFLVDRGGAGIVLVGLGAPEEAEPLLCGRPAPFVGREREVGMLEAMLSGCAAEAAAGVVLVTGPCGSGKSRLSREVAARLRLREPRLVTLMGRGDALAAGSPLGMIADALRRAAGIREADPPAERRRKLEARAARCLPGPRATHVATFLGEIAGAPAAEGGEALRAARRDPMLMGDSTRAAWEEWLAAECAAGPVLLVLDDLHLGDAATVHLVDAALRNLRDLPLLCLALARPEVEARFPGLWAERAPHVVRLGPLSRRAGEALVRRAIGDDADPAVVARVVEHGGGNPFYLEELSRAVAAGRGDAFPASMLDAVEARLDAEGMDAKRALRAASVFGRAFTREGVAALTGGAGDEAAACLSRLAARELIAPASGPAADTGEYVFRDACVREAAYAALTDEDRALGHRLAGAFLERAGPADPVAMAEHFRRGGEPRRSVPWSLRAAGQALEASELSAAIARAEEGVACGGGSPAEIGALRLIQAEAHVWRGELAAAAERGEEAALLLEPGGAPWFRAFTQIALAAGRRGDLDRVEALLGPALTAPIRPGADGARVVCLGFCASQLLFGGRLAAADPLHAALGEVSLASDAQARGIVHQVQAFRASLAGDLGGCRDGLVAALTAFEEAGDRRNACATRGNLGYVHAQLGDLAGAEEALSAAHVAADRLDLADLATVVEHNLGPVLAGCGRLDEARRLEQRAVKAFAQQGDRRLLAVAQVYLARIALAADDLAEAERAAAAALEAADGAPPARPYALATLGAVLLRSGRIADACAATGAAHAALAAGEPIEEGEAFVGLCHARALLAAGEIEALPAALADARARLLDRAACIRDPEWRRRFLADVADNAETLALAAAWVGG
jgi:tetratricopeptide (TPR) repeat protein